MDYNLLKVFAKVSELGSFTQAAKVLNQPKSRVSRSIARLETELDVQLIRRTTRKISLTDSGLELFQSISPLLRGIDNELVKVTDQQSEMSGVIRLTASQDIGQTLVARIISAFSFKYPNVRFETMITNEYLDLTKENIDVAFRAGKLKDSSLIQRKLISANFVVVCSRKYLDSYGQPSAPDDLVNHKILSFKGLETDLLDMDIKLNPTVTSDSIPMLLNMALNGDGITILPDFFCQEQLESKELIRVLPSWKSKSGRIHILYPPTKNLSQRVRCFIKMAQDILN